MPLLDLQLYCHFLKMKSMSLEPSFVCPLSQDQSFHEIFFFINLFITSKSSFCDSQKISYFNFVREMLFNIFIIKTRCLFEIDFFNSVGRKFGEVYEWMSQIKTKLFDDQ